VPRALDRAALAARHRGASLYVVESLRAGMQNLGCGAGRIALCGLLLAQNSATVLSLCRASVFYSARALFAWLRV